MDSQPPIAIARLVHRRAGFVGEAALAANTRRGDSRRTFRPALGSNRIVDRGSCGSWRASRKVCGVTQADGAPWIDIPLWKNGPVKSSLGLSLSLSFILPVGAIEGGGRRVDRCGWRVCYGSSLERRPVCGLIMGRARPFLRFSRFRVLCLSGGARAPGNAESWNPYSILIERHYSY